MLAGAQKALQRRVQGVTAQTSQAEQQVRRARGGNAAVTALTHSLIDYAGLFPPAGLPLAQAMANYADYAAGPHAGMLHCFVLPIDKLAAFEQHRRDLPACDWRLSLLVGPEIAEIDQLRSLGSLCRSVEAKATCGAEMARIAQAVPHGCPVYFELHAVDADLLAAVAELARTLPARAKTARAKIRTGGIRSGSIPPAADVARFLCACARLGVAFKATAGLHHATRAEHPLTYEPAAPCATMHGFLNVFLAAAMAFRGEDEQTVQALLEECSPSAIELAEVEGQDGITWQRHGFTASELAAARHAFAMSFGSCSFVEPVQELSALGWL